MDKKKDKNEKNTYDDGNIPEVDLPGQNRYGEEPSDQNHYDGNAGKTTTTAIQILPEKIIWYGLPLRYCWQMARDRSQMLPAEYKEVLWKIS